MSLISTGYLMYPDVLDGWSSETSKPTSLQHMRSTRVVSRQRKLDDFIKSELQRLNSRLDATDVRIQRLIGGEVPTNPKQFLDTWPYKIHGHSGDPVPLSRIQHLQPFSPLHTKESARSLFKSEEPWELLLSSGMPHPIPTTSCKNHPTIPPNSMPSLFHPSSMPGPQLPDFGAKGPLCTRPARRQGRGAAGTRCTWEGGNESHGAVEPARLGTDIADWSCQCLEDSWKAMDKDDTLMGPLDCGLFVDCNASISMSFYGNVQMTRWADFVCWPLGAMMALPQVQICMLSSSPRNTGPDHLEVARYPWSWLAWLFKLQDVTLHTLMIPKLIQPLFTKPEKTRKPVRILQNVRFGSKNDQHETWPMKKKYSTCLFQLSVILRWRLNNCTRRVKMHPRLMFGLSLGRV